MGWQADDEDEPGGAPGPVRGLPPARDPLLAGFRKGGAWDRFPPCDDLAIALAAACGTDGACPGAAHDELVGLLRGWQALESWAAAGKLGVLRALIGEDRLPVPAGPAPAGSAQQWSKSLATEVALALGMSPVTADRLLGVACDLQAVLPGIGQRLAEGTLTLAKARAIRDAFAPLSAEDAILAEELILDRLTAAPQMTYGQLLAEAAAAAVLVAPEAATARRETAEQDNARVTLFREDSGAAGLSGRDLPTDQTLAANARVSARAGQYQASGAFPGARMDRLRAIAYLDLLNGIPAAQRIATAQTAAGQPAGPDDSAAPGVSRHPQ